MKGNGFRVRTFALAVLVCLGVRGSTHGAELFWNQPAGGLFDDPANWNDGVPGEGDVAIFDVVAPLHTIEMVESRASDRLLVRRSRMRLELAGPDVVYELLGGTRENPDIAIGEQPGNISGCEFIDGVFRVGCMSIARAPASAATCRIDSTFELDELLVGDGGTASARLSSVRASRVSVGVTSTSYAECTIGTFVIDEELVVGEAGFGFVTAGNVSATSAVVGRDAGSFGCLTIPFGVVTIADDLEIGRDGTGVLRLERGGRVEVGGALIGRATPTTSPIEFVLDDSSPSTAAIAIAGTAAIDHVVVAFEASYEPKLGDDFPLITAAAGLATTPVLLPEISSTLTAELVVTDTRLTVRVVAAPCPPAPGEDCNGNGVRDDCDIALAASVDCNDNGRPDECEIADGTSLDCNSNARPDACDLVLGVSEDCNENGIPDECDLADGTSADCTIDPAYDECDLLSEDCNGNGIVDACDITVDASDDCDGNGIPDECDLDCDDNGLVDACELVNGAAEDCNLNGRPDVCEFTCGTGIVCGPTVFNPIRDAFGDAGDAFGTTVDIDGDFAVVGSPAAASPTVTVFVRHGPHWVRDTRLVAVEGMPGDGFGQALAISGSTVVVGAPTTTGGGAAYIFERSADGWSQTARFAASADDVIDGFGTSVDTKGNRVIVGARSVSERGFAGVGSIFVNYGTWELGAVFFTLPSAASVVSGASVAIGERTAAVLWPGEHGVDRGQLVGHRRHRGPVPVTLPATSGIIVGPDIAADNDAIVVRIESNDFRGVGIARFNGRDAFRAETMLEQLEGDSFGAALALADDRLVIGADGDGPAGRVYTYGRIPAQALWARGETLEIEATGTIGAAIGSDGTRTIVGAPTDGELGANAGAAWITNRSDDCNGNSLSDTCDISFGLSQDLNLDGVPDECQDSCPWDLDGSGVVGFNDLSIILKSGGFALSELLQAWGACP